jgi:hypothetical protein
MSNRIAFQGIAGAYSEQAIRQYFGPEEESVPCPTLDDIFIAVERGDTDFGMLPVENAVAGSVTRSYELLMEHDLRVHAEVILRVQHMLIAYSSKYLCTGRPMAAWRLDSKPSSELVGSPADGSFTLLLRFTGANSASSHSIR